MAGQTKQGQNTRYQRQGYNSGAYYSRESVARQVALPERRQRIVERPRIVPAPAPRIRTRRVLKTRPQQFAQDIQARHRHNFLSYVLVLTFFGCLTIFLAVSARLEYSQSALEAARSEFAALAATNRALENEIIARVDFAEIERIAIYELGMIPAEEFQLVEINVAQRTYFSHTGSREVVNLSNFDRFRNMFLTLTGGE